ncbi:MAG: sulfite exporter TauE/SafE family protein [Bacteroidetes bacterium]|nr:sulfite exporter TauE/SafE family protein [Bacteroidota bacterium]
METSLIIEIILTGIGAGLFAGMFGIGGGIVILPVLIFLMGWDIHLVVGTSLAALLLPNNFFALNNYRKKGLLYIKGSLIVALGMLCGNYIGATFALATGGEYIKILFGLYQIIVGIKYIRPRYAFNKIFKKVESNNEVEPTYNSVENIKVYTFVIGGVLAGMLAGMFGIGGGLIITTILISAYKINPKQAVAISLAAMFLPIGIPGVMLYYNSGYVDIPVALLIALGIEVGSNFSSRIALNMNAAMFKQIFGIFLFILGIYFIYVGVNVIIGS